MTRKRIFCACMAMLLAGMASLSQASEALPMWYMAESADVIMSGKLRVIQNPNHARDKFAEPLAVTLAVQKVLKGSVKSSEVTLHYQSVQGQDEQLEKGLRSLNGQTVIVFSYDVPDRGYYIDLYYGEDRVIPSTPESIAKVSDTLAQVNLAAAAINQYNNGGDLEQKVVGAINALSSETDSTKSAGINQLVALGCTAVPYIIKHMQDYRPFHGDLALKTRAPDSFESLMHYNPKLVYDALSDLLSYITGAYFNHSENFDSQADRDADYHGWLVYQSHAFGAFGSEQSPFACK